MHSLIYDQSRLIYISYSSRRSNLRLSRHLLLSHAFRDVRGVAVVLQLVFAALRVAGFVVGILLRVVVGQGHLSELLLRGEWLSARLEVWFGRILHIRDQVEAQVGEDRVDGVDDGRGAVTSSSFNILSPSPPYSSSSSLERRNRKNGGHAQAHLLWLVAGHILRGHRHSSPIEVQADSALSQGILSHGALGLACPFQAIIAVRFAGAVVAIIFFLLLKLHLSKLPIDNSSHGGNNFRLHGRHGGNFFNRRHA